MSAYRAPFLLPSRAGPLGVSRMKFRSRRTADVYLTLEKAHEALAESTYPKLLFAGDPGAIVSPAFAESFAKDSELQTGAA